MTLDSPSEGRTPRAEDVVGLLDSEQCVPTDGKVSSTELVRARMIWYSHHLEESHYDREKLSNKVKELEIVCRSQLRTNASLVQDVQSWQNNYKAIESELVDAAQEIEEAKAYVRSIETANANLRYALSQAREEQERARRRKWSRMARSCWHTCTHLPDILVHACNFVEHKEDI